ncbi:MAG: hypothetical protein V1752_08675 [Candidatus Firestonebacteria bacterium]
MKRLCLKELFLAGLIIFLNGCSEIKPPTPNEIIRQPLGESPLRIGMPKEEVKSLWGNADEIKVLDSQPGTIKEEWIYRGRYPNLPINVDYLAETQHLFFDGESLVNFHHQK